MGEQTAVDKSHGAVERLHRCVFSPSGRWLAAIDDSLQIWRVCREDGERLTLTWHQRLANSSGHGFRALAFCWTDDIAMSSRDGALGLWTKLPGPVPDPCAPERQPAEEDDVKPQAKPSDGARASTPCRVGRPMKKPDAGLSQVNDVKRWAHCTAASQRPATATPCRGAAFFARRCLSAASLDARCGDPAGSCADESTSPPSQEDLGMNRTLTEPGPKARFTRDGLSSSHTSLRRWTARAFDSNLLGDRRGSSERPTSAVTSKRWPPEG